MSASLHRIEQLAPAKPAIAAEWLDIGPVDHLPALGAGRRRIDVCWHHLAA